MQPKPARFQKRWLRWLAPASLAAIALLVAAFGQRPLRGQSPNPEAPPDAMQALTAGTAVGQTFTPEMGGLCRVDVYFSTKGQSSSGTVLFHLKHSPDDLVELATVSVPAARIQDNRFYAFEFQPLPASSKGELLYFSLETLEARPGQAISAWGYGADLYPAGEAQLVPWIEPATSDLVFRVFYLPPAPERLLVVTSRLADNKPFLLGWPGWYVVLGLVYLGLLVGLGWGLAREARDWDQPKQR